MIDAIYVVRQLEAIDYGDSWEAVYCLTHEDAVHYIATYMPDFYRTEKAAHGDWWNVWEVPDPEEEDEDDLRLAYYFHIDKEMIYKRDNAHR